MSNNFEFFIEELNAGAGWGRDQIKVGVSRLRFDSESMSNNFEFFEEELNAGAGWDRGQIKLGVGVNVI